MLASTSVRSNSALSLRQLLLGEEGRHLHRSRLTRGLDIVLELRIQLVVLDIHKNVSSLVLLLLSVWFTLLHDHWLDYSMEVCLLVNVLAVNVESCGSYGDLESCESLLCHYPVGLVEFLALL